MATSPSLPRRGGDGDGSFALTASLITVGWLTAWLAPLTRGRPFLLGASLAGAASVLLDLTSGEDPGSSATVFGISTSLTSEVALLLGLVMVSIGWWLDRTLLERMATPFVAVGDALALIGSVAVAAEIGDEGGSVLIVAVGALLGVAGHSGRRRLTTWIGAALAVGGLISLVVSSLGPDVRATVAAICLFVAAAALGAAVWLSDRVQVAPAQWPAPDSAHGDQPPSTPPWGGAGRDESSP